MESLLSVPSSIMYKKYRICSQHFQDHDYTSTKKEKLKSTACPSNFESFENSTIISELQEGLKNILANQCETSADTVMINSKFVTACPKAYGLVRKYFCLPSRKPLRISLAAINIEPGFISSVEKALKLMASQMLLSEGMFVMCGNHNCEPDDDVITESTQIIPQTDEDCLGLLSMNPPTT
ncbi:hypothetical protein AVEN_126008-1 [Araneus ventricosus]|uniref:THAP-type domain-containing protein n=1 Tax=Araneus ventricosus TaxID=182803 RepID=A0A4Y2PXJ8_ARAVE|nr:hypothetical protein AVEN_126008-1 [Araneus ventricosus]